MMAVYEYKARDENGNSYSGVYENIAGVPVLREELGKMGDTLISAKRKSAGLRTAKRIRQSDVVAFAYKFAGMCSAGLSIIRCLETLEEQTSNQKFKCVLADIRESIETGASLKSAFEKHRKLFSDFFLGMLEAGESGGKIADTLEIAAVYLEKQADLKRKVKSAFAYPLTVVILSIVIVGCLVIFLVPTFSKFYNQMNIPLPLSTHVLVVASLVVKQWWWAIAAGLVSVIIVARQMSANHYLKTKWDAFKLRMPLFGPLNRLVVVSHFIRTFAMLASTGVPFVKALEIASVVAQNSKMTEITLDLQQSINAGNPIAGSLRKHHIFPPIIVQLADSGENVGALPEMLNKGADFIDKDIEKNISSLLVILEPALTVIMGAVVGFILMSVYMPIFNYMSHLR